MFLEIKEMNAAIGFDRSRERANETRDFRSDRIRSRYELAFCTRG